MMMNFHLILQISCIFIAANLAKDIPRSGKLEQESAKCTRQLPAYTVISDYRLVDDAQFVLKISNITENQCKYSCSDNENKKTGKSILCASFTYYELDQICLIHIQRAKPAGRSKLKPAKGFRYYEKFCLPIDAPIECGESEFFRAQPAVLSGFATKMVRTKHLDACVGACVKENQDCKSAMFFYDSGECIINSGTASDRPDAFIEELGEKVVYFENGCVQEDQVRSQESLQEESLSVDEESQAAAESDISIDANDEREAVLTAAEVVEKPVVATNLIMGPWSPWTRCDVPNGRRMRKRDCLSPNPNKDCSHGLIETQWCINNEPEGEITTVLSTNAPHSDRTTIDTKFFGSLRSKENRQATTPSAASISNSSRNNGQWTDWSQRCQPFTPDRPCDPQWRFKIGFQTRQCLLQNNRCDGPLMRYCFIPCGK